MLAGESLIEIINKERLKSVSNYLEFNDNIEQIICVDHLKILSCGRFGIKELKVD